MIHCALRRKDTKLCTKHWVVDYSRVVMRMKALCRALEHGSTSASSYGYPYQVGIVSFSLLLKIHSNEVKKIWEPNDIDEWY